MFKAGEMVIYSQMGVCRVKEVCFPSFSAGRQYYLLEPSDRQGEIFVPVDADVYMRPVIRKEEADRLISLIPSMQTEAFHSTVMQELTRHYTEALASHACEDLIELIMSIYAKKQYRLQRNQKFGVVDESYMKRAEQLLYGEFAIALGIPEAEVPAYIAKGVKRAGKKEKPS